VIWHVYILKCIDGSFYAGVTQDLGRRFQEHQSGKGGHYTKSFGAVELLYQESFLTKEDVLKREAQIKGWTRRKKLALIHGNKELLKVL
jgi:predicted GIY-YIG superfamily endonuclease